MISETGFDNILLHNKRTFKREGLKNYPAKQGGLK